MGSVPAQGNVENQRSLGIFPQQQFHQPQKLFPTSRQCLHQIQKQSLVPSKMGYVYIETLLKIDDGREMITMMVSKPGKTTVLASPVFASLFLTKCYSANFWPYLIWPNLNLSKLSNVVGKMLGNKGFRVFSAPSIQRMFVFPKGVRFVRLTLILISLQL